MVRKESKIPSFCVSGSEHVTRFYIRLMRTFYTWGEQLLASAHERSQLKHQKLEVHGQLQEEVFEWFNYPCVTTHPGYKVTAARDY